MVQYREHRFRSSEGAFLLSLFFMMTFCFWAFLAGVLPLSTIDVDLKKCKWKESELATIFFVVGGMFFLSYFINGWAQTYYSREKLVTCSLLLMVVGSVVLTDFTSKEEKGCLDTVQVGIAAVFLTIGFGIGSVQLPVMFGRLLGTRKMDLGAEMGWFFAVVLLGRAAGPAYGIYITNGFSTNVVAHTTALLLLLAVFCTFGSIPTYDDELNKGLLAQDEENAWVVNTGGEYDAE